MTDGKSPSEMFAVKTVVDVESGTGDKVIPAGTYGVIVESYSDPEEYAVDLGLPSKEWVGGYDWNHVTLRPGQFVFVDEFPKSPYA